MVAAVIRPARDTDLAAVGAVHAASRRDAYQHLLSPDTLATITAQSQADQWRARMPGQQTPHQLSVAEHDGVVVGFCLVGTEDGGGSAILNAVHVHPDAQRAGTGRLLVDAGVQQARSWGHSTMQLWVLEDNRRARGFYEHLGWVNDGVTRRGEINGEPTTQTRYRLRL